MIEMREGKIVYPVRRERERVKEKRRRRKKNGINYYGSNIAEKIVKKVRRSPKQPHEQILGLPSKER